MKKFILFIIAFFVFVPNIYALNISRMEVNVLIDEEGAAHFTEIWVMEKQDVDYLEKRFADLKGVTISDISVKSNRDFDIMETTSWNKNNKNTYNFKEEGDKAKIFVAVDGEADIYTISYVVKGFIINFEDAQGIEWYFLTRNGSMNIDSFSANIKSAKETFDASNTALYAIGGGNLDVNFHEGAIYINAKDVKNNYPIKLMTTFNGISFDNVLKRSYKFDERYASEANSSTIAAEIMNFVSSEIFIIIVSIIGGIVAFFIFKWLYKKFKKHDEYYGINVCSKDVFNKVENADYYDATPCNGDLYKIAFLAGYFKLLKNRSDLIGAILLKWDFENYVDIVANVENPHIKIRTGQYFDNTLDYDLYNILSASASQGYLAGTKLTRYAQDHYLRVMAWFNMGHHDVINNELTRGNIQRVKKMKTYELVLQESMLEDAVKIAGLKKYLLHFNQVPRTTQLTNEGYKYLLIASELLGIGDQVSKEILRKNPDNEMAKKLADLQKLKHLYRNVYSNALAPYKQVVKDMGNKTSYDPEIEQLVTKDNEATKNRRF